MQARKTNDTSLYEKLVWKNYSLFFSDWKYLQYQQHENLGGNMQDMVWDQQNFRYSSGSTAEYFKYVVYILFSIFQTILTNS